VANVVNVAKAEYALESGTLKRDIEWGMANMTYNLLKDLMDHFLCFVVYTWRIPCDRRVP
jgi:hypothetical protein